jgi:hypothetical protein
VEQELERAELGFQLLDLCAFCCKKTLCLTYTSARAGHAQGSLVRLPLLLAVELPQDTSTLFAWLISHQPTVFFSHNKPATSNQPAVLFSQNKSAPAIIHQSNEQAADTSMFGWSL